MEPRIKREAPSITTDLRSDTVQVPSVIRNCSGIRIFGKRIKSLIFTTDIAIILNNDADAVIAVYPFTPHPAVIQSIANVSTIPILSGVGGGTTQGKRSANISLFSEAQGSLAVVVNAPTPIDTIKQIEETVDIPIVCTIVTEYMDIQERLDAGVDILNVSGGKDTAYIVSRIREKYPDVPIIATGGPTDETILAAINAGANAISWTPPSNDELFRRKMDKYRDKEREKFMQEHQGMTIEEVEDLEDHRD